VATSSMRSSLVPPPISTRGISSEAAGCAAVEECAGSLCASGLITTSGSDRLLQASATSDITAGRPRLCRCFVRNAHRWRCVASPLDPAMVTAHGSGNPHYWLDPKNAEFITANILEGLTRIDPPPTRRRTKPTGMAFLARPRPETDRMVKSDVAGTLKSIRRSSPITIAGPISPRRFRLGFCGFPRDQVRRAADLRRTWLGIIRHNADAWRAVLSCESRTNRNGTLPL